MVLSHPTALLVRLLHVTGVGVAVGGAVLTWAASHRAVSTGRADAVDGALVVAETYEWLFWGALGAVVASGVGNLGSLGLGVSGPETAWGTTLALKLTVLAAFLAGSAARTLSVSFAAARSNADAATAGRLRATYAVTTVVLLALVGFGEVLAHG
ncbi:CopD family protein [Haloprofundus salilacus]|uniref:CopD family protein n=1 Tax=Haloprofundus salilacus TaxID=2876190 RepID=UPI001CCA194F|nr:CopD family protein [Haloprofundus salilacus]